LVELVRPHYPSGKRGRPPLGIEKMLRVYFLQQWYGLADEALEDTIYDSQAMRGFAGIDLGSGSVPDATTLLKFRHLLEQHELTKRILEEVNVHLTQRGLLMREGTLVDATIIAAPSSTKNKSGERDPEMHQTKKGNQWFFGMKAHIGADAASGLVHSVIGTAANVSDISQTHDLLHGEEKVVHADAGYIGVEKRPEIIAPHVRVSSSEIPTDFFELSKNNGSESKLAQLQEVDTSIFESEQKIIVYESSPGIQTLSVEQWLALKSKGYLAVHNLSAEAVQIINDVSLDSKVGEIMQDHHLFNQWAGDKVPTRYKNFWSKVFDPGTFDVDDFTVEVSAKRHARFTNHCTQAWKRIIESVTDVDGNLLATVDKSIVRRTVIETAFEMAELYHLPIERVRRYPPKAPKLEKPALGSKLDALIKLDEGSDPIRWGDPTDHRRLRWKKYVPKAGKYGKGVLRSMPYLGHAMTAWAVINFASNPSEAIASELNISPEAAQLLLEGKVSVKLQLWQPNSHVQTAQLADGSSVYIGMTNFYAHLQFSDLYKTWYVTRVEEGEVVGIETTSRTGVVNLLVRVGQEERSHPNVNNTLPGIPEEGKPAPPGWWKSR